jgi:Flp pilus assembly pilin Flp
MDNIYVVRGSEQAGPFTEAQIRAQLASGELTGDSLVWWEGQAEWSPISTTPLGSASAPKLAPAPGAIPAPIAPVAAAPVEMMAPVGVQKTSTLALVSMICGIIAIPTSFCYGIGLALALVAIICGHIARGQLAKNPMESGKGFALSGLICGYVSFALFLVAVVAISVLIALGNQVKGVFSTINTQMITNSAPANPNP